MKLSLCVLAQAALLLTSRCAPAESEAAARSPSPAERIAARDFPSIFQAWNGVDDQKGDPWDLVARHDLAFITIEQLGLKWDGAYEGLAAGINASSLPEARRLDSRLRRLNPRQILLAELRCRDAPRSFLPVDSPYWKRDAAGKPVVGWEEGGHWILDIANPEFQSAIAARAKSVLDTGLFDGVMLDWWTDDDDRLSLICAIRHAIGPDALVLVNANDHMIPKTAEFVNGLYMECFRSRTPEDWSRIEETLLWAETHLREPRINCVETWHHDSRRDFALMRAVTTLCLTHSNGYALFADPDELPTPDHLHDWYPFWDKCLGKPAGSGSKTSEGWWRRSFEHGDAIYNPPGNGPARVQFGETRLRRSTGAPGTDFVVDPGDGDLFLRQ